MKWTPLLCACLLLLTDKTGAFDLATVLHSTSIEAPARVNFKEARHSKLLAEPLQLSGYLEYLENGQLNKTIETPFKEAYQVKADRIEIIRGKETQVLALRKSRHLRTMLAGIEAILAGKTAQIEKVFRYDLSGNESNWSLSLTPKSKRIAKKLSGLLVTGNESEILSIRVNLHGGEWHLMQILPPAESEPPGA